MVKTVEYTMKVPKESKEIVDASSAIVQHFVNGGSLSDAAALLPQVMAAVDGYDKVKDEIAGQYQDEVAGYTVHKMWSPFAKDKAPVVNPVGMDTQ